MCYEITNSYLHIDQKSQIIASTRSDTVDKKILKWGNIILVQRRKRLPGITTVGLSCLWEYFFIKAQQIPNSFRCSKLPHARLPNCFALIKKKLSYVREFCTRKPQRVIAFPYTNHKGNLVHRSIWQTHLAFR
ncbi:BAM_G0008510.mRNA.1.CDS.1 [Saccharomyces cerevisiae]|nr:BAM_G0008510.mRNA.1.CDS.1 [Saccharomyces cerevisiae]CAI7065270.1 BAM_G0008510.mRNA.1.CDS.1 [Saccharomyces cerevisiae]